MGLKTSNPTTCKMQMFETKTNPSNNHKMDSTSENHAPPSAITTTTKPQPKRFIRNQIPSTILNNPSLNAAISLLPSNYNFEIHKSVHRILSLNTPAPRIALQLPEGLLMYALSLSDIFRTFAFASDVFILADVTYGACCVDDLSAVSLGADLLIHYGHSCLVPINSTVIPCLYVFVEISIDVSKLVKTLEINKLVLGNSMNLAIAGTIQFAGAIRAAKTELEKLGFRVLVPQVKPLSAGEVLGCTAPRIPKNEFDDEEMVIVFVADGRFHLEAFMIANPGMKAFRYDPYIGRLFLEEYDHKGMKSSRMKAVLKAKEAKSWGIVLGTLGRQGNPRILERLERKMEEKGMMWTVVLMSEISPARIELFEDSIDAWIQVACPRLSIDWGDAFQRPLLNPFEAEIALGLIHGWWEREDSGIGIDCGGDAASCGCDDGAKKGGVVKGGDYPMDYYAQDGGDWNSCYMKGKNRPTGRNLRSGVANGNIS